MRKWIQSLAVVAASLMALPIGWAQSEWPSKPVRMIVPGAPGGSADITARIFSEALSKSFGQPFVIDNKAGANGVIATDALAKSPSDGYTILFTYAAAQVINPLVLSKLPYHPQKDFVPVVQIGSGGNLLLVNPALPVKDLKEFIAYVKARPADDLAYGSWGDGSGGHLTMEALLQKGGNLKARHVPYKSTPAMLTDVIGGHIPVAFSGIALGAPLVQSGKLRAIAVSGPIRVRQLPEVQTMTEQGISFDMESWYAVIAPAGTPQAIVERLNKEVNRLMAAPEMTENLKKIGFENYPANTPEQFARTIERDTREWSAIVKAAGIQPK